MPAIVDDLGGFTQFPWLFSVYLLAQAVSVPIYAKLADQYGRKPVMLVGVGLFVLGSLLCGLAWSMTSLIAFRAIQGLGAGAVQPIGMTIVGDIYSVEERAKVQGYLASVWAVSAVVGPTLGGVFSDYVSWRWIFFVNLPLGLAAALGAVARLPGAASSGAGTGSTTPARSCSPSAALLLLLGLLEGGVRWAWASRTSIALFAAAAVLLAAFVLVERRAAEPVLPLWVFRHRVLVAAMLTALVVGVLMIGLSSYVPLYAQGVLGHGAVASGFALAAMTLGWPLAASNSGRLYLTVGFRTTMLIGGAIVSAGTALLLLVDPGSSILVLGGCLLRDGPRLRLVASPSMVAAQSSVAWQQRGVATGATMFARSVGSAVGVAVFGAIANARGRLAPRPRRARPRDLTPGGARACDPRRLLRRPRSSRSRCSASAC